MAKHEFKSPWYPYANYLCIIFLALVTVGMLFNPETRMSLVASWVFMAVVTIFYYVLGFNKKKYDKHGMLIEDGHLEVK